MKNSTRSATVLVTTLVATLLLALPALATEAPSGKWDVFSRSQHSTVGAFILLAGAVLVFFAVANAVQQLRGKRGQADGRFRWR